VADLFEAAIDFRDRDLQPSVRDSLQLLIEHLRPTFPGF
jgi:hypothetical protein